jgi:vacuolar protein sorting-associated protein 45
LEREYSQNHSDFNSKCGVQLLVLDRCEDGATPLLHTWTYQSMIHELLELDLNIVQQTIDSDEKILLDSSNDSFYDSNKFKNFGEFAESLSKLLAQNSTTRKEMASTKTISELQNALNNLESVQSEGQMVTKHSKIVNKIITYTKNWNLYDISFMQQEVCSGSVINKSKMFKDLCAMLTEPAIHDNEKLKLAMLYCLRYETDKENISGLKQLLDTHCSIAVTFVFQIKIVRGTFD